MNYVLDYMLKENIPLTQRNYLEIAYMGDKHCIEELEGEELADLPEGFEDWPVDDQELKTLLLDEWI